MFKSQDGSKLSVLLCDDEPDNLDFVATTLDFFGMAVKTARNGAQGLKLLEEFTPNIILCDLSMPEMDGWQLHARIRSNPQTQHIPIIALTAHAMLGDKERVLDAGFDGYISKPLNPTTLVKDIRAAVEKKLQ